MKSKMVVVLLMGLVLSAQAGANLESLKETYQKQTEKIEQAEKVKLEGLVVKYSKALDVQFEVLKKKGDPDPVLAVQAEKDRLKAEGNIPDLPLKSLPKSVQAVQVGYIKAVSDVKLDADRKIVSMCKLYIKALDKLMKEYTAAGKLEDALEIKAEKKGVEFVIADTEVGIDKVIEKPKKKEFVKAKPKKLNTKDVLLGKWNVRQGNVDFVMVFKENGDIHSSSVRGSTVGKWTIEKDRVMMRWGKYWNTFHLPLKEKDVTGDHWRKKKVLASKVK